MSQSRSKFLEWVAYNPVFWNDFCDAEKTICQYYFENPRDWKDLHAKAWDVLSNCDKLKFGDSEVEAYGLVHFLDRYHRFQMIYTKIFGRGYFPTPRYPLDVLDIGSGPAPSLFALHDFVTILNEFGVLVGNKTLSNVRLNLEYLERSDSFRSWVSRYRELARETTGKNYFNSFISESFKEFEGLDFREVKREYRLWLIGKIEHEFAQAGEDINGTRWVDYINTEWKYKFRYNIIIMSNFITHVSDVHRFERELISAGYALRNNGILVIVTGTTDKYDEIIQIMRKLIVHKRYDTKKARGDMKFRIKREKMSHNLNDLYGRKLRELLQKYTEQAGYVQYCPPEFIQAADKSIRKGHTNSWYLTVFQKHYQAKPDQCGKLNRADIFA